MGIGFCLTLTEHKGMACLACDTRPNIWYGLVITLFSLTLEIGFIGSSYALKLLLVCHLASHGACYKALGTYRAHAAVLFYTPSFLSWLTILTSIQFPAIFTFYWQISMR